MSGWRRCAAAALVVALLLSAGCAARVPDADRRDSESVLRAYFGAWQRGDWSARQSFMDAKYAGSVPEPARSIRLLRVERLSEPTSQTAVFGVEFQFDPWGQPVSMNAGHYEWTYKLRWDPARKSWLIVDYGAG